MFPMTKIFTSYTNTVRRMLKGYNTDLYNIFCDQNIEETWVNHDNWNGGIDFYNIVIRVPVDFFETLRKRNAVEETEKVLKEYYDDAMRGEGESIQISNVILKPTAEDISTFGDNLDDSMWKHGQFRLFISHLSSNKQSASYLKSCLSNYGIDCFVAHEDITPSKEWEIEIEKALFTMDALCAILTRDFINSEWCDQEVGIALGQKKLVISVNKGAVPYGFIGKYQALKSASTANGMALEIWKTISTNDRTKAVYWKKLVSLVLDASDSSEAMQFIEILKKCENVDKYFIEYLHENIGSNKVLNSQDVIESVNLVFQKYGLMPIVLSSHLTIQNNEDELPF